MAAQVFEQRADKLFFVDSLTAGADRIRQLRRPTGGEWLRVERHRRRRGAIFFDAHAPGNSCVPIDELTDDTQTCPIKIGVTPQLSAGATKLRKKQMDRGRGLAIGADERMATGAELAGGGTDDTRVLANEDPSHGGIEWFEHVARLQLPIGEKAGLALLPIKIEKLPQR